MVPVSRVCGKCSDVFGSDAGYGTGGAGAVTPCLALLKTRRLFCLQAMSSSVCSRGEESAGLSLLFTTRIRRSSVCEGGNSAFRKKKSLRGCSVSKIGAPQSHRRVWT